MALYSQVMFLWLRFENKHLKMAREMTVLQRAVRREGGRRAEFTSSSLASLPRLSCSGRVQCESACLQTAGFGILCFISPSLARGMEKFERRCDAERHQELERCRCCSEGVGCGRNRARGGGGSRVCPAVGSLDLDAVWLPALPGLLA